jgi:predicted Rossmann fold nucleotide-binding protein DprA/Smf involved in DNA uptake
MDLTEQLVAEVAVAVNGSARISYQGQDIDLSGKWRRLTLFAALEDSELDFREQITTDTQEIGEDARRLVAAALNAAPVEIDDIIRHTGLGPGAVHMALLELELAGRLTRHAGQRVSAL